MGMSAKGQSFGVSRCFFFQVVAAHFGFLGAQGISNTPRICFSLGNCTKFYSRLYPEVIFLLFHIFPSFVPYSFHFPPKNSRWELFGFLGFGFFQFLGELGGFFHSECLRQNYFGGVTHQHNSTCDSSVVVVAT